jgi:hypothetical protein
MPLQPEALCEQTSCGLPPRVQLIVDLSAQKGGAGLQAWPSTGCGPPQHGVTQIWHESQVSLPQVTPAVLASGVQALASAPPSSGQDSTFLVPAGQGQHPELIGVSPHAVTHSFGAKHGVELQSLPPLPPDPPFPPVPPSPSPELHARNVAAPR